MKILIYPFKLLFTIWAWFYAIWAMITQRLLGSMMALFYKDKEWGRISATKALVRLGLFACGFKLYTQGKENIPKNGNFILVSNHQSHVDIVMFMATVPKKFGFIAKKELLKIPVLSGTLKKQGHVLIDRGNARKAVREIERLKTIIKENGKSILFFPEGTRTLDGTIGAFRKGAFQIAVQTGTPIVPCFIHGTVNILNKKSLMMWPGKVNLIIGKPIHIKKVKDKQEEREYIQELMHQTREQILAFQRRIA
ncbi:lysophospholipid acyltransferase family protein [Candidatus Margulisiibacteriota bacterium]